MSPVLTFFLNSSRLLSYQLVAFGLLSLSGLSAASAPHPCVIESLASIQARSTYGSAGYFAEASAEHHEVLGKAYREAGSVKKMTGNIQRVSAKDLETDLNRLAPAELGKLVEQGRKEMPKLYYFTSGAGLWSRGGGQVKALIPFNLKALLPEKDFERLVHAGNILNASKSEDVLKLAGRELRSGEELEYVAARILKERKRELGQLIDRARAHEKSLTPIDIKMVNAALQSERCGSYVPFDIWTSEQTHDAIQNYLADFAGGYSKKQFHPNPSFDARIKSALGKYVNESAKRQESHLFGYQVGYHALDLDGKPVKGTPMIGEGAGMAKAYLEESGRAAQLKAMGKTTWVFENIEVVTDLPIGMAAHVKSGKPVSVILVPEKQGYKGGSPFLIERGGQKRLELHEMSALPEEFANGNSYFNSNTIFQSLELAPPKNLGFEVKNAGTGKIVRVKMNAGDITLEAPTSGIGGRIGVEYENFKNYGEFGQNGEKLIDTFRDIWARDIR